MRSESGKRPAWQKPDRALRLESMAGVGHLHATTAMTLEARDLEAASNLDLLEDFDLVTDLDVVVALDADTAFHAGTYFGSVILEAAQRLQLAFEDNDVFTQYTD